MIVMKFGGTSVANSEAISRVITIIEDNLSKRPVVVVSALSGVTDALYRLVANVKRGDLSGLSDDVEGLYTRHMAIVDTLVTEASLHARAQEAVRNLCDGLAEFAKAVTAVGEITPHSEARIISHGELLSSTVIYHAMCAAGIPTAFVDARKMIITEGDNMHGEPVIDEIKRRVPAEVFGVFSGKDAVITQGFIASSVDGRASTLGRGGSDYSASLIGMALNVDGIEIWTDVDGVKTTDPRRVSNTRRIERISFEEAAEMAHFGAKILHPQTIEPAVMSNIPVYVLNSMNPTCKGTAILKSEVIDDGVKSVSFKENILMLNIFSPKMINTAGFLSRVFSIFAECRVSVDLISTSEANISLTLDANQNVDKVVEKLSEFAEVNVDDDKAQLSIIGKNVVNQRGLIKWAMAAFQNTNIYMISQDASFVNISFVIDRSALHDVLIDLHQYLFEYQ